MKPGISVDVRSIPGYASYILILPTSINFKSTGYLMDKQRVI
jgi:hypothetical protein